MKKLRISIKDIPAIIWGEESEKYLCSWKNVPQRVC